MCIYDSQQQGRRYGIICCLKYGKHQQTNPTDVNEVCFTTTHIEPTLGEPDSVIISDNLAAC